MHGSGVFAIAFRVESHLAIKLTSFPHEILRKFLVQFGIGQKIIGIEECPRTRKRNIQHACEMNGRNFASFRYRQPAAVQEMKRGSLLGDKLQRITLEYRTGSIPILI